MTEIPFVTSGAGVRSPAILYGTAWKKERTQALVTQAIRAGFRGIDTACQPKHYFEPGVGAAVAGSLGAGANLRRADLYLQTKFTPLSGQDPRNVPYDPKAPPAEQVAQSFGVSLRNLQTDYLDCLVLHSPVQDDLQMTQVWQAMEALVDSSGVRQLGISNCYSLEYLRGLHEWARIKPVVVQNRFYAESGYDREIRAYCREHGLLYQSFWTLTANSRALAHQTLTSLAAAYRRSPAQILFRYLTQAGVVPLIGTQSEAHMHDDLSIFELELTDEERAAVSQLF